MSNGALTYLPPTPFDASKPYYEVTVTADGVTVYSECCADTMSVDTARSLHAALGRYLTDNKDDQPSDGRTS